VHYLRPLIVVLALAAIILIARIFIVPSDFGVGERGYMYSWHRSGNAREWADIPVKYQGSGYCKDCHDVLTQDLSASAHRTIQCENCHGPAMAHPVDPPKLPVDRERSLCIRCHAYLPYPTSDRAKLKGIDPEQHNTGLACVECHNPHRASKSL
jgi:predicted CXXCH cytochrome family protein